MEAPRELYPHRRRYQLHRPPPPASKIRVVQDSIKTISKEYCAESSICGLKHLVDANTSYVERIIWILTMIGALVCSVSLVWVTFRKYYMAPLVTTQMPEGRSVSQIIFPAVGICSTNRISKQAVTELAQRLLDEKRNERYNETEMLSMLLGLGQLYDSQPIVEYDDFDLLKLHRILGEYDVTDLMKELTPTCEQLLQRCCWNEIAKNCSELFDFRLTMNGFCCTFNYLRQSDVFEELSSTRNTERNIDMYNYGNKSSYDYDKGLKVLLKFNTSDDFYYNVPLQGAQLQFSDAYDFPDAPSGSFAAQVISPTLQMTVLVSASLTEASRDIQHVSVDLRGCLFHDESLYLPFYTHSDCILKCRMFFLLTNCNCTPFTMPKMNNTRTCDLRDVPCLRKYYAQSIAVSPDVDPIPPELELELLGGGVACPMCYPTCSKTAYNYEFNNVQIYPEALNDLPDEEREEWLASANYTGTSIVHVKYASEVADCYGQNVIMKWFDLFSNIGSTCGFVTGFSFVSVLEFIYFFTVKLIREIRSRQRKPEEPPRGLPPLPLSSISRYRPIYWSELTGPTTRLEQHYNPFAVD